MRHAMMLTVAGILGSLAADGIRAESVKVADGKTVANPHQPQAAVDPEGTIFVAFGAEQAIYCSRSTDGGKSYSPPVKVADVTRLALGLRRGPRIVAGKSMVVISAVSYDGGNLLSWRSTDNGRSWKDSAQVNDQPRVAREGLHAMAVAPGGDVFCTWLDLRNEGTEIFGSLSTDGGRTWGENRLVYRSPSGSVCECCHPAVTYDAAGHLYVMWRNSLNGARDLYVATSDDRGATFGEAKRLGMGRWDLDHCPMDGGWLAATEPGSLTTVWQRDKHVYRTPPGQRKEIRLGEGIQPWIAAAADGAYVVWLSRRKGGLWLATPDTDQPRKLASMAIDPVIAASARPRGPVVVVWETGTQQTTSIQAAIVNE